MKIRVLAVYCGGTIGMRPGRRGALTAPRDPGMFFRAIRPVFRRYQDKLEVDWVIHYTGDSTNFILNRYTQLAEICRGAQEKAYEAVVLFFGTDTMAYMMSGMAFSLHGRNPRMSPLRIPVICCGSQEPVYGEDSDGRFNAGHAFRLASHVLDQPFADIVGVALDRVLLGVRASKVDEKGYSWLASPGFRSVGTLYGDGVQIYPELLHMKENAQGSFESLFAPKFGGSFLPIDLHPQVKVRPLHCHISGSDYDGFFLRCLGEANVSDQSAGADYNVLPFIEEATDCNKPVVLVSPVAGGAAGSRLVYELGRKAEKAGAIFAFDTTPEAAWVKAHWLWGNEIARTPEEFRQSFATSYAGEVSR